jgi:hypothetical protein
MANLSSDQDPAETEPIDPRLPNQPIHGQVHVHPDHPRHDELVRQLTQHLAQHIGSANVTKDYGGHGTGQSSQGAFQQGGASGSADYQTTSVDSAGNADDTGATGY